MGRKGREGDISESAVDTHSLKRNQYLSGKALIESICELHYNLTKKRVN